MMASKHRGNTSPELEFLRSINKPRETDAGGYSEQVGRAWNIFVAQVERVAATAAEGDGVIHVSPTERDNSGHAWFFISTAVKGAPKSFVHHIPRVFCQPPREANSIEEYRKHTVGQFKKMGFTVTAPPPSLAGRGAFT